ncbi:hypothetical protein I5535_11420 [Rhodobacteraceae bacterium F11138]|nr:hypothetical protein [Rhodobacteraceae bacterium F11138]
MNQNKSAISALQQYAAINKPGYAFMIEAPWGSGKTHLVKSEFSTGISNGSARYVSLNGISDRTAFRRALLEGSSEANIVNAIGTFGNTLGTLGGIGNVGSLAQNAIEDRMIEKLPKLLIFDDIERCELSPVVLLGLINDFVEHKEMNVVLCAFIERDEVNEEKKDRRDDFLSRKEKVVGRTVRIMADANKALPAFIMAMPDGEGKQWLLSNKGLVLEVFSETKHGNLRILRQCLHDCGRVIDDLEQDLLRTTDAMMRFVRTYLALSMAHANGRLTKKHLIDRSKYRCTVKPNENEESHPLYECSQDHPRAEVFAGVATSIIPLDLGVSLIGIGYEEPQATNEALRATGQFTGAEDLPLWRRFVEWRRMQTNELETTHEEALTYVFDNDEIEPGPYIHIAHDLISIAEAGSGNGERASKGIQNRMKSLAKSGRIPGAAYGRDYGWAMQNNLFSFGGYAFEPNEMTKPIIENMQNAQNLAFENLRAEEAARLLELLSEDLAAFKGEFSWKMGRSNFYDTAILHEIEVLQFAKQVFGYMTSGKYDAIGEVLLALAERHRTDTISEECNWANEVRTALNGLAEVAGPLVMAQLNWFLGQYWKFPTGD